MTTVDSDFDLEHFQGLSSNKKLSEYTETICDDDTTTIPGNLSYNHNDNTIVDESRVEKTSSDDEDNSYDTRD